MFFHQITCHISQIIATFNLKPNKTYIFVPFAMHCFVQIVSKQPVFKSFNIKYK